MNTVIMVHVFVEVTHGHHPLLDSHVKPLKRPVMFSQCCSSMRLHPCDFTASACRICLSLCPNHKILVSCLAAGCQSVSFCMLKRRKKPLYQIPTLVCASAACVFIILCTNSFNPIRRNSLLLFSVTLNGPQQVSLPG